MQRGTNANSWMDPQLTMSCHHSFTLVKALMRKGTSYPLPCLLTCKDPSTFRPSSQKSMREDPVLTLGDHSSFWESSEERNFVPIASSVPCEENLCGPFLLPAHPGPKHASSPCA